MSTAVEPELSLQGGAPIHLQIQEQIRNHILSGLLQPGEQLPTVRAIAVGLAINVNAVQQAYTELEREGCLTTEDGSGTFVAPPSQVERASANRRSHLERRSARLLAWAVRRGFTPADVLRTFQALTQRRPLS
jgi:GntR family transcriptional regulator